MQADGSPESHAQSRALLFAWLSENEAQLYKALYPFAGMIYKVRGQSLEETTLELVVEVAATALERAERYDLSRPPFAWLLGIANNIIKRWKEEKALYDQRYVSSDFALYAGTDPEIDADTADIFERLAEASTPSMEAPTIGSMWVEEVLETASYEDAQIMRLAVLDARDMNDIGATLHITPGAARVRLHRALKRVRLHLARAEHTTGLLLRRGGDA